MPPKTSYRLCLEPSHLLSFLLLLPPSREHCTQTAALLLLAIHQSNRRDTVWAEAASHCSYKCSAMILLAVRMTT